ncbi:MAG: hypothetical protein A2Y38_16715 [Spirochaetes bacterium GWB1_59_5]|nr:MAG: hypothetical protein A2Y38_16715 [Spirochaetes bacterium GWB1_59_5]
MAKIRRPLVFESYDPEAKYIEVDSEAFIPFRPFFRFRWLTNILNHTPFQKGSKDERKKLSEIRRKFNKVSELKDVEVDVQTESGIRREVRKLRRLLPEGGTVTLTQEELEKVRRMVEEYNSTVGYDIDISLDLEEFLADVPELKVEEDTKPLDTPSEGE